MKIPVWFLVIVILNSIYVVFIGVTAFTSYAPTVSAGRIQNIYIEKITWICAPTIVIGLIGLVLMFIYGNKKSQ